MSACTVNTLGQVPEPELQVLGALGFQLPASARLPLTVPQDVWQLNVFDCFEEEPLEAVHKDEPGSAVAKGGGWKGAQRVEAGTVELEVSCRLKHKLDSQVAQVSQPEGDAQVEEESRSVLWELWVPSPQSKSQVYVLRSEDTYVVGARLCESEPVYTPDIDMLLANLGESVQVVHTVDPRKAERSVERWMPSIHKEIGVIDRAVPRLPPVEVRSSGWRSL